MRILIYGLNYAPEPTGIGKYTGEMAPWLAKQGHEVRAIVAPPYYPAWSIEPGYRRWRTSHETLQDVKVWRSPLWVPAKPSGGKRLVHLASFAFLSTLSLLRQLAWKPDVIVVVAPALACAPGGWIAARLCGAKAWLHIQDFEVDAAFRLGLMKGRWLQRVVSLMERKLLQRFDRVSTISRRMMELLASKGVDASRRVSFPNWVDVGAILPLRTPSPYRAELGIPADAVVALFSGSMGSKQGLEMLPAAARALRERLPNLVIVLCGDGVCKPGLERDSIGLANMRMLPLQPVERLSDLLGMADIHLLTQHGQAADLVMPSKLTGMMSSGRPVLATAHLRTELADVVAGRGIVVPPHDLAAFTAALIELAESEEKRRELGGEARRYAEEHLARDRVLIDFEQALRRCVTGVPTLKPELLAPGATPPVTVKVDVEVEESCNSA